jgi:hypothetical protein
LVSFWLLCGAARAFATGEADASFGPLFEHFPLTLGDGVRTEAAGPLFYQQQDGSRLTWGIPPLMVCTEDPATDSMEFDMVYPILTYSHFGQEYRFQILQLFSFSGGGLQSGAAKHRFTLFPIYFQQRSADTNENYTALFPIYGNLQNRLFRSEIHFVLWPLYAKTVRKPGANTAGADEFLSIANRWVKGRRGDVTTYNYLVPIFHLRYGEGMKGWQVWPLVGHEKKVITSRTNIWNDVQMVPGYEKSFVLWPIWSHETQDIGTTNVRHFSALLPFYTSLRSPARDSTAYIWPFGLTLTDDRAKKYHETDVLWPLIVYARGEGKTSTRVWPLFGQAHNAELTRNFYLWPVYKYSRVHSDPLDRERTQLFFFIYSDVRQKNTETGKQMHRVDFWPFFTHTKDLNGNTSLQVLSVIEPVLSKSDSIERDWSHVWSIWRSEHNAATGASSQSLLWNLYRRQTAADGSRKTSFLFGLFQHRKSAEGTVVKLFYIPVSKAGT